MSDMKFSKNLLSLFLLLISIIFISSFISAGYTESRYSSEYNNLGGAGLFYGGNSLKIDESMCQQGTDFIVQISPLSCEPTVVTSDLLAEENVNVFCKMTATKINPLIDVTDINSVRFTKEYPREVLNIGYMPAQSALGYNQNNLEGSLLLDNMGYIVVTLRKQPNESALTDCQRTALGSEVCWVKGTLTATFNYDSKNSFGVGDALFYLPLLNEEEWMDNYVRYSFWDGRGYLRAENINEESASISVYSDNTVLRGVLSGERRYALQKYSSNLNLKVGEESNKIYLPGLSPCLASLQIKLEGVEDPDTFVRIKVNEDYLELRDGENFLDGRCSITNINSKGLSQEVGIRCREDDKSADSVYLRIFPKVNLEVNGKVDSYEVGDYLYQSSDGKKFVYLGYVGVAGDEVIIDSKDANERMYAHLVALPINKDSLSYDEITSVARHAESIRSSSGNTGKLSIILEAANKWVATRVLDAGKYIIRGEDFKFIPYQDSQVGSTSLAYEFKGGRVSFEGLAKTDYINMLEDESNLEYSKNYQNAIDSFDTVINSYTNEVPDSKSLQDYGELALIEEINLAYAIGQKETMLELCKQFAEDYPNSIYSPEICVNPLKISNSKNAVREVIINGQASDIYFEGVSSPSVSEYSARVVVTDSEGESQIFDLRKDKVVSLANFKSETELKALKVSEYIILEELIDENSARIKISVDNHGNKRDIFVDSKTLKRGTSSEKYGDYTFTLTDIKLEKVAKVSVKANRDFAKSNSTFNFTIGVEKRAIQLSPEKAEEKIKQINKSIEEWNKVSKALGGIVSAGKAACMATEAVLVVKNVIANRNGKAIARQEVMTGEGGWNKICEEEMKTYPTRYTSFNSCFLAHSEQIENDVNRLSNIINKQNEIINGISSENSVEFMKKFSLSVENTINSLTASQAQGVNNLSKLKSALDSEYLIDKGAYTLDELKEIQMYAMYLQSTPVNPNDKFRETAIARLNSVVADVNKNSEGYFELIQAAGNLKINPDYVFLADSEKKKDKQKVYQGETLQKIGLELSNLKPTNPVATAQFDGKVYVLVLDGEISSKHYPVMKTSRVTANDSYSDVYWIYDNNGNFVRDEKVIEGLKDYTFQVIDATTFKNPYKYSYGSSEILLKYSGTYAYRNKPVVVPFDKKEGWYAGISSPGTAYDSSGRIREFWLCNVGEDGIEEFQLEDFGGDHCLLINMAESNGANSFSEVVNVKQKIEQAVDAISIAQKRYKEGVTKVYINANVGDVKVGEPLKETPQGECTDYMSVEDCTLLFNVCDPVVCPSSRCDFGGKYPVTDVIQTGVVGSLFLCYPNAKWEGGDIYVPFCLSGINAGIENWISVKKAYAECLQKGIDTGETVGICDEMHSIYLCEFFWKQAIPVVKLMGPKIIEKVIGSKSRGGGEYQTFGEALKNAQNSIDYFTQYYAENSYRAFKARSTEEIGGAICGSFASVVYPDSGSFLSNLIAPDSPFQFTGKFEETSMTTSTNPPTSHYKVYFHIYAGTDSGAYYSVYLRGSGSSYYQDTASNRMVDSGYIPRGEFADESIDFTAPSGYNTLCITVNGREECGFKEVSSSFAVNYLSDLYVKDQATASDIKTKEDCTSGSASIYSLLDLNAQSAADNLLNAELYSQGIIRVCATESPGSGSDPFVGKENARWKKVGYCDNKNIGCWIDTESVEEAMKFLDLEEEALEDIDKNSFEYLSKSYYSIEEFNAKKTEINEETNATKKLELIKTVLESGKVFYNNQKAFLYFQRGKAYATLSLSSFEEFIKLKEEEDKLLNAPCDESILGKRILTIAQNKIGRDTTRLQNGQWVNDNVCATFVSNVLIEAEALPALGNDPLASATSDRDAIVELIPLMVSGGYTEIPESEWKTGLKEGDVIVWGCKGLSYCASKPDADQYQHVTIFSNYDGTSIRVIHDSGTGGPVEYRTYSNPFGTTWYITHVYRAACTDVFEIPEGTIEPDGDEEELGEGYVSPAIEFEDGSSETNVCYKFFNSEWHWAIAETGRSTYFNPSCNDPNFPNGREWFDTKTFVDSKTFTDGTHRQLDDVSVDFVKSLDGKDYLGGIELLIKRTTNLKKEGMFNKELSSYYRDSGTHSGSRVTQGLTVERDVVTTMDRYGVFKVEIRDAKISPIYYQLINPDGWKWGTDKDKLVGVSTTVIPSGSHRGLTPAENVNLINSLKGISSLYEGAAKLFDPETSSGGSYNLPYLSDAELQELLEGFSNAEKKVITNAMACRDCGGSFFGFNICDKEECEAIGIKLFKDCEYTSLSLGFGKCEEKTSPSLVSQETFLMGGVLGLKSDRVFFRYVSSRWQWSPEKVNWMDVSTTKVSGGEYDSKILKYHNLNVVNALNELGPGNQDYLEGKRILKENGALMEDRTPISLSSSSSTTPTTSFESNFQRRDVTKLTNLMNLLSTSVSSASFRCNCGENCDDYAKWIVQYTGQSNIPDELLLLAIMIQESSCKSVVSADGGDIGLMQINLGNCGYYGLPTNKDTCQNNLLNDEELNIRVGAQHLRLKYSTYKEGLTFNCPPVIETYSGWEAALRGYNGWGCTGDDNYVENVKSKYLELLELYN